jgi:sec-independent protein translocase protein TatB
MPFDIGLPELITIVVVALVVFGPDRLPEFLRNAGRLLREVQQAAAYTQAEVLRQLDPEERQKPSPSGLRRYCLRCHYYNREDSNFCGQCGAGLFPEESELSSHAV